MGELVSVIMPAYNAAAHLEEALDSALAEADATLSVEIILADDGSTDETAAIAQRYARTTSAVRYLKLGHCGRAGAVRNHAIAQARGEYVAFLDADDFWLPGGLAPRIEELRRDRRVGFVHGNFYSLRVNGTRWLRFKDDVPPTGDVFSELFARNFIHTSSVIARRDLVQGLGGFHAQVRTAEDYWLWLGLAHVSRLAFVREPVSVHRLHTTNISYSPIPEKLVDLIEVVDGFSKRSRIPRRELSARLNPLRFWLAKQYFGQGRYLGALGQLFRATTAAPLDSAHGVVRVIARAQKEIFA